MRQPQVSRLEGDRQPRKKNKTLLLLSGVESPFLQLGIKKKCLILVLHKYCEMITMLNAHRVAQPVIRNSCCLDCGQFWSYSVKIILKKTLFYQRNDQNTPILEKLVAILVKFLSLEDDFKHIFLIGLHCWLCCPSFYAVCRVLWRLFRDWCNIVSVVWRFHEDQIALEIWTI